MSYVIQDGKLNPFWTATNTGIKIHSYRFKGFLEHIGFGRYQTIFDRNANTTLFQNDNGILKLYIPDTLKIWVREFLEAIPDDEFNDYFNNPPNDKFDVLSLWQETTASSLEGKVTKDLNRWSESGFEGTNNLKVFSDKSDTAHIIFSNGVVRITKDDIELLSMDSISDFGSVWESSIRHHNIKLTDKDEGLFCKFFNLAMYRDKKNPPNTGDWRDEFSLDDEAKEELVSLRTSYGYLIHTHNTADVTKCIYYIDYKSQLGLPMGGNGKSLVMESVEHYKKKSSQDGKRFRQNMDGDRFQFSNVDIDTRFVFIDDITPEFHFEKLFSMITGDMEVEGKGKDKFVIPKNRKPKFGVTTNYVMAGSGTSFSRRQHVVEFGSYWARCEEEKEKPSDKKHLGNRLFEGDGWETDSDEWNHFYNFGFRCVQQYLRDGLVESSNKGYITKAIKLVVEGKDGDGQGTDWITEWIKTTRLEKGYNKDKGISEEQLYKDFCKDNLYLTPDTGGIWDRKFFSKAVWTFTFMTEGYYYNQHLSNKGDTKSSRRWLQVPEGSASKTSSDQIPHIRITTDFDSKWLSKTNTKDDNNGTDKPTSTNDDKEDYMKIFDDLAKY